MEEKDTYQNFQQEVGKKEKRRLKALHEKKHSIWQGFSVFGLIGWSVAVPTILFALIGVWLDKRWAIGHSFTLSMLVAGLILGCVNAWYWVSKRLQEIEEEEKDENSNKNSKFD